MKGPKYDLPSFLSNDKAYKDFEAVKQPLNIEFERNTMRPELERLAGIVGSRAKQDIKFNRALAHRRGALNWAKKQGVDRHGKPKYYVYDDDLDDDGIPEVVIRNNKGNLYAMNGYRTTKSDAIFRNRYLDAYPTREQRKKMPYQKWLDEEAVGAEVDEAADPHGFINKMSDKHGLVTLAKTKGYKSHFTPTNSVLKVFTKNIVKPYLENFYSLGYSELVEGGQADGTATTIEEKGKIWRENMELLPTATSAIANKAFNLLLVIPLMTVYKKEFADARNAIVEKYNTNGWIIPGASDDDKARFLNKEAFKKLKSKKSFKEVLKQAYIKFFSDGDMDAGPTIGEIVKEAVNAKDSKPFVNIWGEPVRVNANQSPINPFAKWNDSAYKSYAKGNEFDDDIADRIRQNRMTAYNMDSIWGPRPKPSASVPKSPKRNKDPASLIKAVPSDEYSDDEIETNTEIDV